MAARPSTWRPRLLAEHPRDDLVLVGHGTAWTLLLAELTGSAPDLDAWAALRMPDVWEVDRPVAGQQAHHGSLSTS